MRATTVFRLFLAVLLLALPLHVFAAIPKLVVPPEGERWFSISVGGDRVGFAHMSIARSGDGYRIDSEGSVKMRVMGFSREAISRESYQVGSDLAIRSFATDSLVDGKPIALKGEATPLGVKVAIDTSGKKSTRTLKVKGPLYPSQALNLYPLMHGATPRKSYRVNILDPESAKVKQIKVEVVGEENVAPGTPAVHLKNNLYPMVDNDIWVDLQGNTIKESVREDLVLTVAQDEKAARAELVEAALSRKEPVLEYAQIDVEPPLERPQQLKKLVLEVSGIPQQMPILQGKGQQGTRLPDGKVLFTMPNPAFAPAPAEAPTATDLQPLPKLNHGAPDLTAKRAEILRGEKDPAKSVRALAEWVAKQGNGAPSGNKAANSLATAREYTALARASGIPTRIVSGLVYSAGHGFLYHCWAESYLNDAWYPVDPAFGEAPANVTHIKLVKGDSPEELGALAGVIGKLQVKVVEKQY